MVRREALAMWGETMDLFFYPPLTHILIFLNVLISGYAFTVDPQLNNRFDLDIGRILRNREWWRLITSGFVHADPMHFLVNMFTLYVFGRFVEQVMGPIPFLVLYFGSEMAANLLTLALKHRQRGYSSLGASGAICGVVLSFCLFQPFAKIYVFLLPIGIPAFIYGICYVGYSMFQVQGDARDGIAHEAHLGGAVAGLVITTLFQPDVLGAFLGHFGI